MNLSLYQDEFAVQSIDRRDSINEAFASIDNDDDDNDVWCNPEDEANWKHRLTVDEQRERQLREILGDELLRAVRQRLQV